MTPTTFAANFNKNGDLTKKNKAGQLYYDMFLELAYEAENTNEEVTFEAETDESDAEASEAEESVRSGVFGNL